MTVGSGAELARGYISLSVKYAGAMAQVSNDFKTIEDKAAATGKKSGEVMGKEMSTGLSSVTGKSVSASAANSIPAALKPIVEKHAKDAGKAAGEAMGKEMVTEVTKAVTDSALSQNVTKYADGTMATWFEDGKWHAAGESAGSAAGEGLNSGIQAAAGPMQTQAVVTGENIGNNIGDALMGSLGDNVSMNGGGKIATAFDVALTKAKSGISLSGREAGTLIMGAVSSGMSNSISAVTSKTKGALNFGSVFGQELGQQISTGIAWSIGRDAPKRMEGALSEAISRTQEGVKPRIMDIAAVASGIVANGIGRGAGFGIEAALNAMGTETPLRAGRRADTLEQHHLRTRAFAEREASELASVKGSGGDAAMVALLEARVKKAQKAEAEARDAAQTARSHHEHLAANFDTGHELRSDAVGLLKGAASKAGGAFTGMASAAKGAIASIAGPLMGLVSGPMAALIAGLGTAAGIGMTLKAGFDKAAEIDKFKTKLEVLGRSAGQTQFIVNAAGQAVKGTTYEIGDLLETAQTALDAGGSTGLTQYLRTVTETATITGQSVSDVDAMLGEFRHSGTATAETLANIGKSGLPISKWLQQDLKMSDAELKAFVDSSGLTYQRLMETIQAHAHSGAQQVNHTFEAQFKIMGKNLTDIGQAIIAPFIGVGVGPFEGLNTQLEHFANWLTSHQPEIIQFFTDVAVAVETMAARALTGFSKLQGGFANLLSGLSRIPGLDLIIGGEGVKGLREAAATLKGAADEAQNWANSIEHHAIPATQHWGDQMKLTVGFNQALKDKLDDTKIAIAELNSSGGLEIHDATPGIIQNLKDLGLHLKQIGSDPTHLQIIPDTQQAIDLINQMRVKAGQTPIKIPVNPDFGPGEAKIGEFVARMARDHQIVIPIVPGPGEVRPGALPWGPPGPSAPANPQPPGVLNPPPGGWGHRAEGGFTALPHSAVVQSAVYPKGLVQWAEPSTGGEAYIPLATSKRERSVEIWKQTGNMLGVTRFEGGGISGWPGAGGSPVGGGIDAAHSFLASITGGAQGSKRAPYGLGGFSPSSIDCSGMVSATINSYLGLPPFSSRMSTSSEESWLRARGFKMGVGPPGSLQVGWYDHGGGAAGHTALTLPDGTNAESTTSNGISGARVGPLAAGASSSQFSQHAYLIPGMPGAGAPDSIVGPGGGARASAAGFGPPAGGSPAGGGGAAAPGAAGGAYPGIGPGGVDLGVKTAMGDNSNPYYAAGAAAGAGAAAAGAVAGGNAVAGGGQDPLGQLADIGVGGVTESLLPPGFSNPMNSPMMKSAAGLLNFLGGVTPGPGGKALSVGGALLSGSGSGVVSALRGFQQLPGSGAAGGDIPGQPGGDLAVRTADAPGGGGYDASIHYHAPVNGDMSKVVDMHMNAVQARDRAVTNYDIPRNP